MPLSTVSFAQITRILEVTDSLGLNREWIEIPLAPERPGLVRRLASGKLEIIVDAAQPFEDWLASLPKVIQVAQNIEMDTNNSGTLPTREELNAEILEVPEPPEQPEAINEPAYEDIVAVALRHVRGRRGGALVTVILVASRARRAV